MAAAMMLLYCVARAAPFGVAPQGAPTSLLDPGQRAALGLRHGPDSIVDVWTESGRTFLVFSGAAMVGGRMAGGATFRLPVDPGLKTVTGGLSVLMRAECRDARPGGGQGCTRFDSDYAGAGTVFTCPAGPAIYVYHGENHTMPNGQRAPNGQAGWTGIGLAMWDEAGGVFVKQGQIAGLNAPNVWGDTETGFGTAQTPAASGNPSLVPDPTGLYLYLYFADRTRDPESTGPGKQCDRRTCLAVARATLREVCAEPDTARWQIWHRGSFAAPSVLPDGTGGAFTPLDVRSGANGSTVSNVTAVPALHGYVMTSVLRPSGDIVARISTDGLIWSASTTLVAQEGDDQQGYARIVQVPGAGGEVSLVLLYVKHHGRGWPNASLLRQALRVTRG